MENTLNHGWKMNLQLFAEDGGEGGAQETGQNEQSGSEQSGAEQNGAKTYSAEEVMRLIQSETDKRVTQALNKQKREYEKKLSLSGLGEQERAMAEKDQQITDLQAQVAELTQFRTRQAVMTELSARGIAPELADLIALTEDEGEMKSRLDTLETAFRGAVEAGVKARLTGGAPNRGSAPAAMTRDAFRKMSLAQQQELYRRDPETYKKMTEG